MLKQVLEILQAQKELEGKYRDYALTGNDSGFRECHVQPDWRLVYTVHVEELIKDGQAFELFVASILAMFRPSLIVFKMYSLCLRISWFSVRCSGALPSEEAAPLISDAD